MIANAKLRYRQRALKRSGLPIRYKFGPAKSWNFVLIQCSGAILNAPWCSIRVDRCIDQLSNCTATRIMSKPECLSPVCQLRNQTATICVCRINQIFKIFLKCFDLEAITATKPSNSLACHIPLGFVAVIASIKVNM
ncbi:Hypothetical_protein [Hexamita inflata]|uniref:Hypothetical_protein n=1 Tax=Hexamita inflata TaxID=28002 RepID=A0ABP1IK88_9EUKA